MANKSCLGIHYTNTRITTVMIEQQADQYYSNDPLKVTLDDEPSDGQNLSLIGRTGQSLACHSKKKPPVALSLGGHLYQSLSHHSEFSDIQQLNQTLRYDIEEDFATNADSIAICYQQKPCASSGLDLLVHTTNRDQLEKLLGEFEQADLDALVAEPDLVSWTHWLVNEQNQSKLPNQESLIAVGWAVDILYILALDQQSQPILARSLTCSTGEQAHKLLMNELPRSLASLPQDQQPRHLLYHSNGLNPDRINELASRLGLQTQAVSEPDMACACASGVAMGWLKQCTNTDFRADRLTPHTLTMAKRRAFYGLGVAVSFFLMVWISLMYVYLDRYKNIEERAGKEVATAWELAFAGTKQKPPRITNNIPKDISRRLDEVRQKYRGKTVRTPSDSASNTLMLVFQGLSILPEDFDLEIKYLSASPDSASFDGSVPNMGDLEKLFGVFDRQDSPMEINRSDFREISDSSQGQTSNRRNFKMPLQVKQKDLKKKR